MTFDPSQYDTAKLFSRKIKRAIYCPACGTIMGMRDMVAFKDRSTQPVADHLCHGCFTTGLIFCMEKNDHSDSASGNMFVILCDHHIQEVKRDHIAFISTPTYEAILRGITKASDHTTVVDDNREQGLTCFKGGGPAKDLLMSIMSEFDEDGHPKPPNKGGMH